MNIIDSPFLVYFFHILLWTLTVSVIYMIYTFVKLDLKQIWYKTNATITSIENKMVKISYETKLPILCGLFGFEKKDNEKILSLEEVENFIKIKYVAIGKSFPIFYNNYVPEITNEENDISSTHKDYARELQDHFYITLICSVLLLFNYLVFKVFHSSK